MKDNMYYFLGIIAVLIVLAGIVLMSRVRSARAGNALGALGLALAVVLVLLKQQLLSNSLMWGALAAGLLLGALLAARVKMLAMPQLVALLNGLGGLASALVAYSVWGQQSTIFEGYTGLLALAIGMVTFSGSMAAAGKLARLLPQRQVVLPGHTLLSGGLLLLILLSIGWRQPHILALLALLFGGIFAIRVGGADMPITISLLNSTSGVAGGVAGIAIADPVLTCIGAVVGASGLLLTQIMCRAMNRSLLNILFSKNTRGDKNEAAAPAPEAKPLDDADDSPSEDDPALESTPDLAAILNSARDVILVPGYGMALAQAQSAVKALADRLAERGAQVRYAIHPVAGRMPGHMNVLLCEVDVPYEQLYELDDINSDFATCDLVLVIGANDTINPAANTEEGTPIYGMPVLAVAEAKWTIVCNLDTAPGYAGVPNPLYDSPKTILQLGDAKESLAKLLQMLQ